MLFYLMRILTEKGPLHTKRRVACLGYCEGESPLLSHEAYEGLIDWAMKLMHDALR